MSWRTWVLPQSLVEGVYKRYFHARCGWKQTEFLNSLLFTSRPNSSNQRNLWKRWILFDRLICWCTIYGWYTKWKTYTRHFVTCPHEFVEFVWLLSQETNTPEESDMDKQSTAVKGGKRWVKVFFNLFVCALFFLGGGFDHFRFKTSRSIFFWGFPRVMTNVCMSFLCLNIYLQKAVGKLLGLHRPLFSLVQSYYILAFIALIFHVPRYVHSSCYSTL